MKVLPSSSTSWCVLMGTLRNFHVSRILAGRRSHSPQLIQCLDLQIKPGFSSSISSSSFSCYSNSPSTSYSSSVYSLHHPSSTTRLSCRYHHPSYSSSFSSSSSSLVPSRGISRAINIALKRRQKKTSLPPKFRLIDEEGTNLGIMSSDIATKLAESKDLKLVEVKKSSPDSEAIYRLYTGKQRYEQEKKRKKAAKKTDPLSTTKELTIFTQIGEHDLAVKLASLRDFLEKGHRARLFVKTKYRRGINEEEEEEKRGEMVKKIAKELKELGEKVSETHLERRGIMCQFVPIRKKV